MVLIITYISIINRHSQSPTTTFSPTLQPHSKPNLRPPLSHLTSDYTTGHSSPFNPPPIHRRASDVEEVIIQSESAGLITPIPDHQNPNPNPNLNPNPNPNIVSSSSRPEWPTIYGPLGLSEQDSVAQARKFFTFGFILLHLLWAVNCFYFWPVLRNSRAFPRIRPTSATPPLRKSEMEIGDGSGGGDRR